MKNRQNCRDFLVSTSLAAAAGAPLAPRGALADEGAARDHHDPIHAASRHLIRALVHRRKPAGGGRVHAHTHVPNRPPRVDADDRARRSRFCAYGRSPPTLVFQLDSSVSITALSGVHIRMP